ncbi:hypothetical protein ACGFNU_30260 [Spirillospora sp. NPDC048911]|uniref:hypothetical protein n=1 Tax=Spirillospora sp. NPDC048911 TaxID=3364527 RepID=UPI00370FA622
MNRTTKAITTTAALTGAPGTVPYALDPWTGKITPIGARTSVTVALPAGAAKIIVLAGRTFAAGRPTTTTDLASQQLGNWTLALDEWLPGGPGDASSRKSPLPGRSWCGAPFGRRSAGATEYR